MRMAEKVLFTESQKLLEPLPILCCANDGVKARVSARALARAVLAVRPAASTSAL